MTENNAAEAQNESAESTAEDTGSAEGKDSSTAVAESPNESADQAATEAPTTTSEAEADKGIDSLGFVRELAGYAGGFLGLILLSLVFFLAPKQSEFHKNILAFAFVTWAVVPPLWLLFEYNTLWPLLKLEGKSFDEFQHEQNLLRNVWASLGVVMALMFFVARGS